METNNNDRRHQDDVRREIAPGNQNEDYIGINKEAREGTSSAKATETANTNLIRTIRQPTTSP